MHKTTPKVFLVAQPQIIGTEMSAWLEEIGAEKYNWQQSNSDAENMIMAFAKRCYMAFEVGLNPNVKKVRDDMKEYLDNILAVKHGSVLAHAHFSFAIENVSRVFTGEMNRHSAGTDISEGSMRFISFEDFGLVETNSMKNPKDKFDEEVNHFIKFSFEDIEEGYTDLMLNLEDMGYDDLPFSRKKELTSKARRAIGMGISTGGIWTGNVRAIRWIIEQRGSKYAEEEILFVSRLMLKKMMKAAPLLFGDFEADKDGFFVPKYSKV